MNEQRTANRTSKSELAGTNRNGIGPTFMVLYNIPIRQRHRGVSRFEKRLRKKRRKSLDSFGASRQSKAEIEHNRAMWGLLGIAVACLAAIEVILWIVK